MQIQVDTHTHTYASGHAYSTLIENAKVAKEKGIKILCCTDHASTMPGAPHYWYFNNQRVLPRFIDGVGIIRGVESNIINTQGDIDIHPTGFSHLDWIIASFHEAVIQPSNKKDHTEALLNTIKSGKVDALGHLGNPNYDFDFETVVQCAKEHNVAIELNNSSLKGHSRVGSEPRCERIAQLVKEAGGFITTGSDAHFADDVGDLAQVSAMIDDLGIDSAHIITHTPKQFVHFLTLRGRAPIEEFESLS